MDERDGLQRKRTKGVVKLDAPVPSKASLVKPPSPSKKVVAVDAPPPPPSTKPPPAPKQNTEEKIQKEIEERHDLIARLDRANDVARHAENETRDVRLGMKYRDVEVDRSAQEKILEADLAMVKRELFRDLVRATW